MRRGHTLMEMLVVITLLTLFAGIVAPRFIASWSGAQMNAAVSAVRNDFAFARARAASTGLRHQVMIDSSSGELIVQPFRPEQASNPQAAATAGADYALQDKMPPRITVVDWQVSPLGYDTQGAGAQAQSDVLTFYPEGRSDSALVVLEGADGRQRGVQVDGFTGEVRELTEEELREQGGTTGRR
ncbi:MAG: hypothetical protein K0Q72_1801 [Armatimonadetes bacterium]|jgi:prepilin-type N-terminal cleavage/methylation domain-containing protein|nr:hypothetical protein [Armatimonadota bacterium]